MIISKRTINIVLFFVLSLVYLLNLSHSVYGGDVGDLVTAAAVGGVAHAPGYPLFTFVGSLLIRFFGLIHLSPALAVGLISVFAGSTGVLLYYQISIKLTSSKLASLVGAITLSFSYLYWMYTEIAEVFALNNFFALLSIYLAISFRQTKKREHLLLLAFVTGLSLSNHQSIVLIFPSLALIVYQAYFQIKKSKKLLIHLILLFLGGLLPYLYIIIASLNHPIIDGANITSAQSFIDFFLRKGYGTFELGTFEKASSFASKLLVLKSYSQIFLAQVTIPVVLFSLIGIVALWMKDRVIAVGFVIAFLLAGPIFVVFAGFPLNNTFFLGVFERFLSLSSVVALLLFPPGIVLFAEKISHVLKRKAYAYLFIGIFLIIPIKLYIYNQPKVSLSKVEVGDILGENYLKTLPKNSIVLLTGDTNLYNTLYVRYAKGFRPDVTVLNGNNPGFARAILEDDPRLRSNSPTASEYNKLAQTLKKIDLKTPVYSDQRINLADPDYLWIPAGLVFELRSPSEEKVTGKDYKDSREKIWNSLTLLRYDSDLLSSGNLTLSQIPNDYAQAMVGHAQALLGFGYVDDALKYTQRAISIAPTSHTAYALRGSLYLIQKKDCKNAIIFFEKAIQISPITKIYYQYLYTSYMRCSQAEKAEKLKESADRVFGNDSIKTVNSSGK